MKIVLTVIVALLACGVQSDPTSPEYGEAFNKLAKVLHDKCVERSKIEPEVHQQLKKGKFPENTKAKKYVGCLWLESTVIDKDLNLKAEILVDIVPSNLKGSLPNIIKKCHANKPDGEDVDTTIYLITKCIYESDKENYAMI